MKFWSLVFAIVLPLGAWAQGNLQFNQVIMVGTQQQTVPSGKVWKVISYLQAQTTNASNFNSTSCTDVSRHSPFLMNGNRYYVLNGVATGISTVVLGVQTDFPFWAPAGTTFQTVCSADVLSIIEFNIVP